jgi:hypothetical protein
MLGAAILFLSLNAAFVLLATQQNPPTAAPLGWLIMWLLCARRKKEPIGGWLAYYYYQIYFGVLLAVLMVAGLNIHSYVLENFAGDTKTFVLFLLSTLPSLVLLLFQMAVATFLLVLRTWDMVELLRKVLIAQVVAETIGLLLDVKYFPDNVPLSLLSFAASLVWLAYFYRSARVRHVFKTRDWELASAALTA